MFRITFSPSDEYIAHGLEECLPIYHIPRLCTFSDINKQFRLLKIMYLPSIIIVT